MANEVMFEGKERRMPKIEKCLAEYGLASLEEARDLCVSKGFNPYDIVKGVQPIAFENAGWAYACLLYTSPSPRDRQKSRMPSSA